MIAMGIPTLKYENHKILLITETLYWKIYTLQIVVLAILSLGI